MADDCHPMLPDELDCLWSEVRGARVAVEDRRFLLEVEVSGIDADLCRPREPLDAVLAVDSAKAGFQRCRPGGPDQPMLLIQGAQDAIEFERPALGRVGTKTRVSVNAASRSELGTATPSGNSRMPSKEGTLRLTTGRSVTSVPSRRGPTNSVCPLFSTSLFVKTTRDG